MKRSEIAIAVVIVGILAFVVLGGSDFGGAKHEPTAVHTPLPTHKTWRAISVQPYVGEGKLEFVKVDYPTAENPMKAIAFTEEGLKPGDPVCLDLLEEVEIHLVHPVPEGGCPKR